MAATKTSSSSPPSHQEDFSQRFWGTLSYAFCELCLILLLHVAAAASYAATRLARVCGLKPPCVLCSRPLDRDDGEPWFSSDTVCSAHRAEVSSLACCNCNTQTTRLAKSKNTRGARKQQLSSENAIRSDLTDGGLNRLDATDSTLVVMTPTPMVAVSGHVPTPDHHHHRQHEKAFVVSVVEEINESDGSPSGRDDVLPDAKESATTTGTTTTTAKPASTTRSSAPSRIFVDRNSSVKNAFLGRLNLPSPRPSEIISARDSSSTTQQEVKALLSQISSRGLDSSSSTEGTTPSPSLERSNSVLEPSSDGNNNLPVDNNIEGEAATASVIESLRKQVELSKKSLAALYKELEEERSASAIAASQTMAMINRLQEEKAAMQMEALQYLRMMEEQADHDHEAIQNLHDLLTDREKELLDMDAELASCRRLLQNGQQQPLDATAGRFDEFRNDTEFTGGNDAMSYFEDERAYILESLSRLEEDLCISTSRLASDDAEITHQGDMDIAMLAYIKG